MNFGPARRFKLSHQEDLRGGQSSGKGDDLRLLGQLQQLADG
jgi:hypothetical protein